MPFWRWWNRSTAALFPVEEENDVDAKSAVRGVCRRGGCLCGLQLLSRHARLLPALLRPTRTRGSGRRSGWTRRRPRAACVGWFCSRRALSHLCGTLILSFRSGIRAPIPDLFPFPRLRLPPCNRLVRFFFPAAQPFTAACDQSPISVKDLVASRHRGGILTAGQCARAKVVRSRAACRIGPFTRQSGLAASGRRPCGLQDGGVRPRRWPYIPGREEFPHAPCLCVASLHAGAVGGDIGLSPSPLLLRRLRRAVLRPLRFVLRLRPHCRRSDAPLGRPFARRRRSANADGRAALNVKKMDARELQGTSLANTRVWAIGHGPDRSRDCTPFRHDAGAFPIILKGTASGPPGTPLNNVAFECEMSKANLNPLAVDAARREPAHRLF
jgi:hypothetical protein